MKKTSPFWFSRFRKIEYENRLLARELAHLRVLVQEQAWFIRENCVSSPKRLEARK